MRSPFPSIRSGENTTRICHANNQPSCTNGEKYFALRRERYRGFERAVERRKGRDSRFLKKILTIAEIDFVQNAENHDKALWVLWSCKETAYKVIKKKYVAAAFLPCRWEVILQKSEAACLDGEVQIPDAEAVYVRLFSHFRYVHCIGTDHPADLDR